MAKSKFFQIYLNNEPVFNILTDEEIGRVMRGIFAFCNGREIPDLSDNKGVWAVYLMLTDRIARDFETYDEKCQKLKKNSQKRYASANASNCKQKEEKEKEKEKEEEDEEEKKKENVKNVGRADSPALSQKEAEGVMACYNRCCADLPQAKRLSKKRLSLICKAKKLLNDISFEEYFARVQQSDFLTGRNGKWTGCGFDWLLCEDNLIRVLEGSFDNRTLPRPENNCSYDIKELSKINTLPEFE